MYLNENGGKQMLTVAFHTLGCRVNQYETEAIMDQFVESGYSIVEFEEQADVYVINSCTVTSAAARKTRQFARRSHRNNPDSLVVVAGCYPQVSPDEVAEIEEIDLLVGTDNKSKIVELVNKKLAGSIQDREIKEYNMLNKFEELKLKTLRETTRANIKIQEGCNQFCSYCIIPYARGALRSRDMEAIIQEVKKLTAAGVKEIVLTGIHLGAFGIEQNKQNALTDLLEQLIKLKKLQRIRLSSLEITEVRSKLLEMMAVEDKICRHLHLPLQSGTNKILQAMNRPYTIEQYRNKLLNIKNKIPEIAISTDVIVGFPGEKENDFKKTYQVIKELKFSRLHVFPFSPREGTPAAEMKQQVDDRIIKKNTKKLRKLNKQLMLDFQRANIGKKASVLFEYKSDKNNDMLSGYSDNYIRVLARGDNEIQGKLKLVEFLKTINYQNIEGKIV